MKKRMLWADLIRIVAIYFVVQIHTLVITIPLVQIVSLTSVPLLVMLSGALLLGKQERYTTFFRKRCMKVLVPWVIWTIVYMIFYFKKEFFLVSSTPLFIQWMHYFFRMFLSNLWFLPLIFSLYLVTPLFRLFIKNARQVDFIYGLGLWFLLISVLPFLYPGSLFPTWEATVLFVPLQYSGYFVLGYFLKKEKYFMKIQKKYLILLLVILSILLETIKGFASGFLAPGAVIASIAFSLLIFNTSQMVNKYITPQWKKFIAVVSGTTLGVYIIHPIITVVVMDKFLSNFAHLHLEILFSLLVFISSIVIIFLLQKIPIVKYIVP